MSVRPTLSPRYPTRKDTSLVNNQTQGSVTNSVPQSRSVFPECLIVSPQVGGRTARFLNMVRRWELPSPGCEQCRRLAPRLEPIAGSGVGATSRPAARLRRPVTPQPMPESVREACSASARIMVRSVQWPKLELVPNILDQVPQVVSA